MDQGKNFDPQGLRNAIQRSAYTTTLTELEKKGRKQVKVIKGRRIYQLIAQAVDQVVEKTSLDIEQKKAMVEQSRVEFDRLLRSHHDEARRLRDLEVELSAAKARVEFLEDERARLEAEVAALRGQTPARDQGEQDLLRKLVADVAGLNNNLSQIRDRNGEGQGEIAEASSGLREKFSSMLEETMNQLSDRFNSKLDRMEEEKSYRAVEAAEVALDGLFAAPDAIESNFDNVEVRSASDDGGIGAELSRLRDLRGGLGADESKTETEDDSNNN